MCIIVGFQKAIFMMLLFLLPNSIGDIRMGRSYPLYEAAVDICGIFLFTLISIFLMNNCVSFG